MNWNSEMDMTIGMMYRKGDRFSMPGRLERRMYDEYERKNEEM